MLFHLRAAGTLYICIWCEVASGCISMRNRFVCEETCAEDWTLPCQVEGNFCCRWTTWFFLVQWAECWDLSPDGSLCLSLAMPGDQAFGRRHPASGWLLQEWSEGKMWIGIGPEAVWYITFPSVVTVAKRDTSASSQLQSWEHPNGLETVWNKKTHLFRHLK